MRNEYAGKKKCLSRVGRKPDLFRNRSADKSRDHNLGTGGDIYTSRKRSCEKVKSEANDLVILLGDYIGCVA